MFICAWQYVAFTCNYLDKKKRSKTQITENHGDKQPCVFLVVEDIFVLSPVSIRSHKETKMAVIQTQWYLFVPLNFVAMLEFYYFEILIGLFSLSWSKSILLSTEVMKNFQKVQRTTSLYLLFSDY